MPLNLPQFCQEALAAHNHYRRLHQAPPLLLDAPLCQSAQAYAQQQASLHTHSQHSNFMGENLYWSWGAPHLPPKDWHGATAVDSWYSEVNDYYWPAPEQGKWVVGHFTAIVWQATTHVGIGAAYTAEVRNDTPGFALYVVAHYRPAGNVIGLYQQNVLPMM